MQIPAAFRHWAYGLAATVIGGVAHSIPLTLIAPESFNFHAGLAKLCEVAAGSGILAAALYLSKSPLPPESDGGIGSNAAKVAIGMVASGMLLLGTLTGCATNTR